MNQNGGDQFLVLKNSEGDYKNYHSQQWLEIVKGSNDTLFNPMCRICINDSVVKSDSCGEHPFICNMLTYKDQ